MSKFDEPQSNEPFVERIDPEAEQRELEAARWEPVERQGKTVWRNPESGYLYPQGVAVSMLREGAETDLPLEPEDSA